jgi:hypothetical protein
MEGRSCTSQFAFTHPGHINRGIFAPFCTGCVDSMPISLCSLPPEIFGVFVFAMLDGAALTRLESATVSLTSVVQHAYQFSGPISTSTGLESSLDLWKWCWKRNLSIQKVQFHATKLLLVHTILTDQERKLDSIELHCPNFMEFEAISTKLRDSGLASKVMALNINNSASPVGNGFTLTLSLRTMKHVVYKGRDLPLQSQQSLITIINENSLLESLRIDAKGALNPPFYNALAQRGPTLTELSFIGVQISVVNLTVIAGNCPRLLRVLFKNTGLEDDESAALMAVAVGCPLLQELTFDGPAFCEDAVLTLAKNCPELRRVSLAASVFTSRTVRALATHCKRLVALSGTWGVATAPSAETRALYIQLQSFAVKCEGSRSTVTLQSAVRCMPDLRALKVLNIAPKHVAVLTEVSKICTHLESLSVACSDVPPGLASALIAVVRRNPQLTEISLHAFGGLPLYDILRHCKALTIVETSRGASLQDCELAWLAEKCPKLRRLRGSTLGCSVTDRALTALAQQCSRLREVNLAPCCSVTGEGLLQLATHCRRLESVTVSHVRLTAAVLDKLNDSITARRGQSGMPAVEVFTLYPR